MGLIIIMAVLFALVILCMCMLAGRDDNRR